MTPVLFCKHFFASHYIPIAYYEHNQFILSIGNPEENPLYLSSANALHNSNRFPATYTSSDSGLYGMVIEKNTNGHYIIGPVYNYSYYQFLNTLVFIHLLLNDEELSVTDDFNVSDMKYENEIATLQVEQSYLARDEHREHGTYQFEQQLLEYVKQGNPERMKSFLLAAVQETPMTEGKLADSPLRQAKNLLIGIVTMVGKYGAIPGGMDIEQTYQLIDTYIQECEKLIALDDITNLQYNMIMDFTNRVSISQTPPEISEEVFSCVQYIKNHINEPLKIEDIAQSIHRSQSYITKKFKTEIGKTIGEYILTTRMKEAKTLLKYTKKSLSEISDYLCFSSQPYFQNTFKKYYGITPAAYRKKTTLQNDK